LLQVFAPLFEVFREQDESAEEGALIEFQSEGDVGFGCQEIVKGVLLVNDSDVASRADYRLSVGEDLAFGGWMGTEDGFEKGAFTAAARADDRDDLSRPDFQIDLVQNGKVAEAVRYVADF
jgi:hypothetical protein